jgi:drug/metabolite transporter (DMT)-like permease
VGISILLFTLANWLISLAQVRVESSLAAVLAATTPLWMALFALAWRDGDRLSLRGWLGLLLGLGGVIILMSPRLLQPASLWNEFGPLLVLGSASAWALGSLVLRHTSIAVTHLTSAGYQMLFGGVLQVLVGLAIGEVSTLPPRLTAWAIATFFYLLVVGSLCGFVAYNWLLGHVPAAKVGTYAYINPAIALTIGWLTGEPITAALLAGIAVILVGVYLVRGSDARMTKAQ